MLWASVGRAKVKMLGWGRKHPESEYGGSWLSVF